MSATQMRTCPVSKYRINKGREVTAMRFETVGTFVDFYDGTGEVTLRLRAEDVNTVERVSEDG